jgi:tripartite-type tricarboxylate transporter receptor subunit TctC
MNIRENFNRRRALTLMAALPAALALSPALAQEFPSKPIRIIVGQAAGGGMDTLARLIGSRLADALRQPVVVENKVGAGGIIGTEFVAKAPADGYTLLMGPIGNMVFAPILTPRLRYDAQKDFAPVALVATFPLVLLVNSKLPVKSVPELVAYVKANPGKANFGGSGPAFQFASEQFKIKTQTTGEFVQYKSMSETITALISGDLLTAFVDPGPAALGLADGRLRALAVTSPSTFAELPNVPTMNAIGMPELQMQYWAGLFAPAGTPAAAVKRLETEINRITAMPDMAQKMTAIHVQPASGNSQELARLLADDLARWREVARVAKIKPNE